MLHKSGHQIMMVAEIERPQLVWTEHLFCIEGTSNIFDGIVVLFLFRLPATDFPLRTLRFTKVG